MEKIKHIWTFDHAPNKKDLEKYTLQRVMRNRVHAVTCERAMGCIELALVLTGVETINSPAVVTKIFNFDPRHWIEVAIDYMNSEDPNKTVVRGLKTFIADYSALIPAIISECFVNSSPFSRIISDIISILQEEKYLKESTMLLYDIDNDEFQVGSLSRSYLQNLDLDSDDDYSEFEDDDDEADAEEVSPLAFDYGSFYLRALIDICKDIKTLLDLLTPSETIAAAESYKELSIKVKMARCIRYIIPLAEEGFRLLMYKQHKKRKPVVDVLSKLLELQEEFESLEYNL